MSAGSGGGGGGEGAGRGRGEVHQAVKGPWPGETGAEDGAGGGWGGGVGGEGDSCSSSRSRRPSCDSGDIPVFDQMFRPLTCAAHSV